MPYQAQLSAVAVKLRYDALRYSLRFCQCSLTELMVAFLFQNLVFAILLVHGQLVALVRMKKLYLHPTDLHLILNLVSNSESLKAFENWAPICLPKFNSR